MSVSTDVSKYMGNAVKLADIWGSLIFNVKSYGAKGNGITDDTSGISSAIIAASTLGGVIAFPPGTYKTGNLTVPFNVTLWFMNGSKLSINTGATVTINGSVDAGLYQIFSGSGTVSGAMQVPRIYPQWWGAKGDGVNDDTSAMQATRNYAASLSQPCEVIFPAGIYKYSVSPNWAIQYSRIVSDGEVILRYTGTDHAVILNGKANTTPVNAHVYNMHFGKFFIEAPSTAKDGVFIDGVHHSKIDVVVRGAGSAYSGVHLRFGVCNEFWITVSVNEEGWYSRPTNGLRTSKLISGEIASYNIFYNTLIEGTVQGSLLDDCMGNSFLGGTMEGCLDNGLLMGAGAIQNKFYGLDFEANAGNDITCNGLENHFFAIDSTKIIDFGATSKDNAVFGGSYKNVTFESGSTRNLLDGIKYNRQLGDGTTGVITDNGTYNRIVNCNDVKNSKIGNRPTAITAMTVGASPFAYTNTTGNDERVFITGGTISSVALQHGVSGDTISGYAGNFITLCPGDILTVTYTVAPTMRKYTT